MKTRVSLKYFVNDCGFTYSASDPFTKNKDVFIKMN